MNLARQILRFLTAIALSNSALADIERNIGIEGRSQLTLDRGDYRPKPLDDRTPLILRIETVQPVADGGFLYDFKFIGFEPGPYRLIDYLVKPDGSPATGLGEATITVQSVLPPDHDGSLTAHIPAKLPWIGGYRLLLWGLGAIWVLGLLGFWWFGRRRETIVEDIISPPAPSYAERMQPYVTAAAAGTLGVTGQAELERLMTAYWREKLALPDSRMADALTAIKQHPEAGSLVRAMERWLHRPGGASQEEIRSLLEPYQGATAPKTA